jgi:hypothetical protein
MTKRVAGDMLLDIGQRRGIFDGALQDGFVQMVPTPESGFGILKLPMRGKYPLPSPIAICIRVLSAKRFWKLNAATAFLQILFENNTDIFKMRF